MTAAKPGDNKTTASSAAAKTVTDEKTTAPVVDPKVDEKTDAKADAAAAKQPVADEKFPEANTRADSPPDPLTQFDTSREINEAQASDAIKAELDPEIETNPAVLGYQISQFDETGGSTVLDSLAYPPQSALRAQEAVDAAQARTGVTDTDVAERAGAADGLTQNVEPDAAKK